MVNSSSALKFRRQRSFRAILVLTLGLLLGLAYAQEPVTLRIGVATGASTLDIHLEPDNTVSDHLQFLEGLMGRDDNGELEPRLATSWEYLPEERAWVFELRRGVVFHDGQPFTADDVKFSIDRILELGTLAPEYGKGMRFIERVEVIDSYTVKLYILNDDPLFFLTLTITPIILPQTYFTLAGAEEFGRNPVGTGPYRVVRWQQNQVLELERFEGYWGEQPDVDRVIFRVIPDESSRVAELLSGGIDLLLGVPAERAQQIERDPNITLLSVPSTVNLWLDFNSSVAPYSDPRVRQAIALAVPTEQIRQALFGQFASEARTIVHKTSFGHDPSIEAYPYDPDRARSLLAEAGYANGFTAEIEVPPLALWPKNVQVAEAIAGALREVGIVASVKVAEFANFFPRHQAGELAGMFLWGNTSATLDAFRHLNLNFNTFPGIHYRPLPETQQWITDSGRTGDVDTRLQLYSNVQRAVKDAYAVVPLLEYASVSALREPFHWSGRGDNYLFVRTVTVNR